MTKDLRGIKREISRELCLVCKTGKIVQDFVGEVSLGFHCEKCGIKYKFLPGREAYCSWGQHYVDSNDLFDDGQTSICHECQRTIR
ncbi:MAG: hypothetical protein HYT20_01315 [Candidatus Nealsonbacteria bacterium]|nr:hypothetical protein [Candidatus Nealsonbacteria bacterium]